MKFQCLPLVFPCLAFSLMMSYSTFAQNGVAVKCNTTTQDAAGLFNEMLSNPGCCEKASAFAQSNIVVTYNNTMQEARTLFNDMLFNPYRYEQAMAIRLDNELHRNLEGKDADFYYNPLLLNGLPLSYANFSIGSQGILTLVKGNPESPEAEAIPFHIYLRRNSVILYEGASSPSLEVQSIDIEKILAKAQPEDHLIIEPVRKQDWKAKRILRIVKNKGC